jgi:hypothetical protein
MKDKLEKFLENFGYFAVLALGFTILYWGIRMLGEIWYMIFTK